MNIVMIVSNVLRILSGLFLIGYSHPLSGFPLHYSNGNTYIYSYETVTSFNDLVTKSTNAATDVGFSIKTNVHITPIWSSGNTVVVKLSIVEPHMRSVSRPAQYKDLQALPRLPVYFQWSDGRVDKVYMSTSDPTLAVNIKKGIISLFQLRAEDGQHTEIDSSGECDVNYKTSNGGATILKTKTNCKNFDIVGRFTQVNELLGVDVTSQSSVQYSVRNEILHTAQAYETWRARVNLLPELLSQITASQNLTYIDMVKSEAVEAPDVESLMKKLNKGSNDELYGSLGSTFESRHCSVAECRSTVDAVREYRESLKVEAAGKESTSAVFIELVQVLRRSSADDIYKILADNNNKHIIMSLIDATTAAQTKSSQEALVKYLKFNDAKYLDRCERFLLSAALSTHPSDHLVKYLLGLFRQRVSDIKLRESISEALGAVTKTFQRASTAASKSADGKLISEVEAALLKELEGCGKDTTCKLILIRSLANAGLPLTLPTLITLAQDSGDSSVSEAAVRALHRFNISLITSEIKHKLVEMFHERKRRYDTTIRSQILTLLLKLQDLNALDVTDILLASTDPLNTEFNTYIQAKLFNTAKQDERIRKLLLESLKDSRLNNYHTLAPKGKSLAFTSLLADAPQTNYHMYVENSRSGLMKRSGMDISVNSLGKELPVYNFGIQAAGLEGTIGEGQVDDAEKDVEVTAGMSLDMIGVSLRPITFFTGQAGLMSAVWNAPSEPVSALQTNFLLQDHSERIHLHNGLVAELNVLGAVSMDLSGSLSVSLWNKNAQSLIKNSGGITIGGSFQIITTSFQVGAEFKASGGTSVDFRTDVDFYDGVKLCLQMSRPSFQFKVNSARFESARGFSKSYKISSWKKTLINGLSYPLPSSNSHQCKLMEQNKS